MKTLSTVLMTTVAVAAMSAGAQAADLMLDAPAAVMEAAVSNWTGPYIGIQAGVISLTSSEDYDPSYATPADPYWELGSYGGSVGVFAGFDYQVDDMFVLGISGEVNLDNVAIEYDGYDDYLTLDWDAAIKVRAGMLLTPSTLLYATVGYSYGSFAFSEEYWSGYYNPTDEAASGWIVGAGIESEVADGLFVRGEATATFYDDLKIDYEGESYWIATPTVVKATLGLAYKF
jgi:outer membrane immunogenic protein